MPINVKLSGAEAAERVAKRMDKATKELPNNLKTAAIRFGFRSVSRSIKDFLSGPRPERLGVVTGRLRSSIGSQVTQAGNDIEVVIGSKVKYARRWELGFKGTETVKTHSRFIKKAFGKTLATPVLASIGSFTRKANSLARPFLSPAVTLELPEFERDIAHQVKKTIDPGVGNGE
jgi:hypothetical protein